MKNKFTDKLVSAVVNEFAEEFETFVLSTLEIINNFRICATDKKGFSVLVPHPHPTSHRITPRPQRRRQIPYIVYGISDNAVLLGFDDEDRYRTLYTVYLTVQFF